MLHSEQDCPNAEQPPHMMRLCSIFVRQARMKIEPAHIHQAKLDRR